MTLPETVPLIPCDINDLPDEMVIPIINALPHRAALATSSKRFNQLACLTVTHIHIPLDGDNNFPSTLLPHLSSLPSLTAISVICPITSVAALQQLTSALSITPLLLQLSLNNTDFEQVGPAAVSAFCAALQVHSTLQTLRILPITYSYMPENLVTPLTAALPTLPNLQSLDLGWGIPEHAGSELATVIKALTGLKKLILSKHYIAVAAVCELAESIGCLGGLQSLSFGGAHCYFEDHVAIADMVEKLTALTALDLGRCQNLERDLEGGDSVLAASLRHLTAIRHLNLNHCQMAGPASMTLSQSLTNLTRLQHIDLANNILGNASAPSFSACFQHLASLKYLDLRANFIGCCDEGGDIFVDALRSLTNLEHIDLRGNRIGSEFAARLTKGLNTGEVHLPVLEYFYVGQNCMQTVATSDLRDALLALPSLKCCDLRP